MTINAPVATSARASLTVTAGGGGGGPGGVTGLVAWWTADDAASITASGGAVSQWNDKSGNGYHLTQGTGSVQPSTGTRTLGAGSRNVIDFDGGDTLMRASTPSTALPLSIAFAWCLSTAGAYSRPFTGGTAANTPILYAGASANNWIAGASLTPDLPHTVASGGGITVARINIMIMNGASSSFWENGTQYGGTLDFGTGAFAGLSMMADSTGSYGMTGGMGEYLIYDHALSAGERGTIQTYLSGRWT